MEMFFFFFVWVGNILLQLSTAVAIFKNKISINENDWYIHSFSFNSATYIYN